MMAGWAAYKTALIVADGTDGSMRVQRPSDGNDTVSEGISYGMLFAVYMNDKTTFDAVWKYEQKHLNYARADELAHQLGRHDRGRQLGDRRR